MFRKPCELSDTILPDINQLRTCPSWRSRKNSSALFFVKPIVNIVEVMRVPYQATIASLKIWAKSSGPKGRGESLVTRCCGSVPSTSAGISDD